MPRTPFFACFADLPDDLPVFPLPGVIVMPGAELPLNVFEPRYLNMVEDALKTHHMFGMVQPDPSRPEQPERLFQVGCAGRITSFSETEDGRILLSLSGMIRFRIDRELQGRRGYRVVQPRWDPYADDLKQQERPVLPDRALVIASLKRFLTEKKLQIDWRALERVPDLRLVHMMATLLPLGALEKQAILEAVDPLQRAETLQTALQLSSPVGSSAARH
jgi:Lon protease-like protein